MAKTSVLKRKSSTQTLPAPRAAGLLKWYDKYARDLPWREHNGRAPSPYHTWISEIMLQQTTVATVIPYYKRFISRWPTVQALAAASDEDVMKEWAGLGYYSRARNLHACAKAVTAEYGGVFPAELAELKKLPGIGPYTAAAIRTIAFDLPANVVDGNVERVMSRIFAYDKPLNEPKNKKALHDIAAAYVPAKRPGDYAQALMDLGATVCTPQKPNCGACPWQKNCAAFASCKPDAYPVVIRKKSVPTRHMAAFLLFDEAGRIYLRRRPAKGLLGGLWEPPSTDWRVGHAWENGELTALPFFKALRAHALDKQVVHVFTHFKLICRLYVSRQAKTAKKIDPNGDWFALDALPAIATLTEKMLRTAKALGETPELA